MKKSMKIRTAKKIVKVIKEVGLDEATRRYNIARVSKAQYICKGPLTEWPHPDKAPQTTTIKVGKRKPQLVTFGKPFAVPAKSDFAAVYEELKKVGFVASNKKRKRIRETYQSYKSRNRTLCKFKFPKFPHIKVVA